MTKPTECQETLALYRNFGTGGALPHLIAGDSHSEHSTAPTNEGLSHAQAHQRPQERRSGFHCFCRTGPGLDDRGPRSGRRSERGFAEHQQRTRRRRLSLQLGSTELQHQRHLRPQGPLLRQQLLRHRRLLRRPERHPLRSGQFSVVSFQSVSERQT